MVSVFENITIEERPKLSIKSDRNLVVRGMRR